MIKVDGLSKSVRKRPILTDLSFQLRASDRLGLVGENGAGKSLLLKILATLVRPTAGTLLINDQDAFSNLASVRPSIGYLPQIFDEDLGLTAGGYLNFFARAYGIDKSARSALIEGTLELTDLNHLHQQNLSELSVGQRSRTVLAKTVLHDPQFWLLDDPLAQLDPQGQAELGELIRELGQMDKIVVLASNHLTMVQNICNRLAVLHQGRLVYFGALPTDLLASYNRLTRQPTADNNKTSRPDSTSSEFEPEQ